MKAPFINLELELQDLQLIIPLLVIFGCTIYHVVTNKNLTTLQRTLWLLVIIFASALGWLVYWTVTINKSSESDEE